MIEPAKTFFFGCVVGLFFYFAGVGVVCLLLQ